MRFDSLAVPVFPLFDKFVVYLKPLVAVEDSCIPINYSTVGVPLLYLII